LEDSRFYYENSKEVIKKHLPAIYSDKMNIGIKEKLETAEWFKFENLI